MNNQDNEKVFQKSNINWLITIYPRIGENLGKIKVCDKQHLACFKYKYVKIDKKLVKNDYF